MIYEEQLNSLTKNKPRASAIRSILHEAIPLNTPYTMSIYTGDLCNIQCHYCIQSNKENCNKNLIKQLIDWDTFKLIADQTNQFPQKIKSLYFAGLGEPTLHPRLIEMIKYIKNLNTCEKIFLVTNATKFSEEYILELIASGIDKIDISIQGNNAEMYLKNSNATIDFDYFYNNIKFLFQNKKQCKIYIQTLSSCLDVKDDDISKKNREEFFALYSPYCDQINITPTVDLWEEIKLNESITKNNTSDINGAITDNDICSHTFYSMHILANGDIIPCCAGTMGYRLKYANVRNITLFEAFNGKIRREFLKSFLLHKKSSMKNCKDCHEPERQMFSEDVLCGHELEILTKLNLIK